MSIVAAIPGQPSHRLPLPRGAADAAIMAVDRLNEQFWQTSPFSRLFGERLISAQMEGETLVVWCDRSLTRTLHHSQSIAWYWAMLWRDDGGWYDPGWHPDRYLMTLRNPSRLWDALNPAKRYRPIVAPPGRGSKYATGNDLPQSHHARHRS